MEHATVHSPSQSVEQSAVDEEICPSPLAEIPRDPTDARIIGSLSMFRTLLDLMERPSISPWSDQLTFQHLLPLVAGNRPIMSGSFEKLLGRGDLPKVRIRHSSGASAEVYTFGATVTSYKTAAAKEVLFLSESSAFDGKKAIRGGIPLVFSQFGQPSKAMASHGFARISNFDLAETRTEGDIVKAVFELSDSEATRAVWPFPFRLSYTIALAADSLRTSLDIHNTGSQSFDAQALLHTYYRVDDVRQVSVHGFKDKRFLDKVDVTEGDLPTEDRDGAVVDQEVDRIYHTGNHYVTLRESAADQVAIEFSAAKTGIDGGRTPLPTNCVFWNPWIQKAKALSDLHDDEYMNFVCIEPGVVASPFNLGPGESLTLEQHLRPQ